jgi:hypothetical protein
MARSGNGKDYYVEEAALANIDSDGTIAPVIPMRWFTRCSVLWAVAHRLRVTPGCDAYVIDAGPGGCFELPLTAFFLTAVDLNDAETQARYNLPPLKIAGMFYLINIFCY